MDSWKSLLKDDPTGWLLEESNPSVRYFTLLWLLDRPENDAEVLAASQAIARSAPVLKVLRQQRPGGYWGPKPHPHTGMRGRLVLLSFLGYRGDEAIRRSMREYMDCCISEDGAYTLAYKEQNVRLPCHAAGLLRLMLWFGFADDPRSRKMLNWLLSVQQPDGVWSCVSKVRPFPCLWATADVLRALRDLPAGWVTPQVEQARNCAVELFLKMGLSRYGKEKPSPSWFKFGFPLQWDTDILEVLELIAPYTVPDEPRIQEGLSFVLAKQDSQGRWPLEKYPKGGNWMQKIVDFEEIGQPSKWVTLHALRMMKALSADKNQP